MKLNLANRLTILRVLMIPLFVVFILIWDIPFNVLWAFIVFVLASVTDWLDGFIARKYNMITDLGKFLDPLADKVLVISALICFLDLKWIQAWTVIIIVAREFIVTGFRLAVVGKDNKAVIAADIWGKAKTAFTMVTITFILLIQGLANYHVLTIISSSEKDLYSSFALLESERVLHNYGLAFDILIYISVALTVISGATMIWKNRKLFGE